MRIFRSKIRKLIRTSSKWPLGCRLFLAQCERYFEAYGRLVAENPKRCILICLLLVACCGLGIINLRIETETEKLFVPTDTKAEKALERSKPHFVNLLNSREQAIIFQKRPGYNLLAKECVREAKLLIASFITNSNYKELCVKRAKYTNSFNLYDKSQICFLVNPYEVIFNNTFAADDLTAAFKNNYTLMSNGKSVADNKMMILPIDTNALSVGHTNALRIVLYLNEYNDKKMKKKVLAWEKSFIDKLEKDKNSKKCFTITFTARRSLDDAIVDSSGSDVGIVSVAFALMNIFTSNSLGKFSNSVRGHSLLAMSGIYSTALGILAGFGITILIGTPFTSVVGILPFLILSVGIDDIFIIVDEFDNLSSDNSPERRVGYTMAKVGASITMTTLTDIIGFAVSASSAFPVIRYFCIYATITFTAEFLLQISLFVALLTFDAKRINANRRDCLPFCKGHDRQRCSSIPRTPISKIIMTKYAKMLVSIPGKLIVVLTASGLLALGVYGCYHVGESFDRRTLIKDGQYLGHYLDSFEKTFPQTIEVNIVQDNIVDYSNKEIQKEILDAPKIAITTGYYSSEYRSWLEEFLKRSHQRQININGDLFSKELKLFLSYPQFASFMRDVRFNHQGEIVASQTQVFMKHTTSSIFQRDAMLKLREAFKDNNIKLTPTSDPFIYFEQYAAVTNEVVRNICVTAALILIITAPFCMFWSVSFLLLLGFAILLVDLIGLMYFWNVTINAVSMINLVMSFGFTVDYSAHVAHAFVTSREAEVDKKVIDALSSVGTSVFFGGFSTFLGMVTLGLASTEIFQIFFKMFVGIVFLGLFNGLALLPVLFSLFSKVFIFKDTLIVGKSISKNKGKKGFTKGNNGNRKTKPSVSVVGISARFPTARNKDEFWNLLVEGRNTLSDYPSERKVRFSRFKQLYNPFRIVKGRLYVTQGSYLEDIDKFDNSFFGISHSEAKMMDPQQKILLQGVFEAIEDAGLTLQELQAVNTGVYIGSMNLDYTSLIQEVGNSEVNQFTGTGTSSAIIANRISFALNLRGPSLTVDTACSSSLTALNIAYEHLKNGKCDIAIVGASNAILDQNKHLTIGQAYMLAADGQSKVFDSSRDGYGRGEGMVVVVIRPKSHIQSDDKSIYCNILACNVNNDGQSAIPMTAPSVDAQGTLFKTTCMEAGISSSQVSYIEAHGTGTVIGDRVETQSISDGYCLHRDASNPLPIGSVKSNINHTESVAGLAGLAKVCLMMENNKLVPTVGIKKLNPELMLGTKALVVQQNYEDWNGNVLGSPKYAAINSFGFGGSNAHVVVEEPNFDHIAKKSTGYISEPAYKIILVSARSKSALRQQAAVFSEWLSEQNEDPQNTMNICYSLFERRTAHNFRCCVVFKEMQEAVDRLKEFAVSDITETSTNSVSFDRVKYTLPKIGFVFGGNGSDWDGMVGVLSQYDELRHIFDLVDKELSSISIGKTLFDDIQTVPGNGAFSFNMDNKLLRDNVQSQLNKLTILQLSIFKVQYAISTLLIERCNVVPTAVVGHSLGDIIAACVSGCISLRNALQIIILRSELQNACRSDGKMAALGMSGEEARELLDSLHLTERVTVAAINDSKSVTLSGDHDAIEVVKEYLTNNKKETFWKILEVAKAYHSYHMDSIKHLFWKHMKKIKLKSHWTTTQFISSVYAKPKKAEELTTAYWWDNIREPVNFYGAATQMRDLGCQIIVELSPKPVLKSYLLNICKSFSSESNGVEYEMIAAMPSLKSERKIEFLLSHCIGKLYNVGYNVDFTKLLNLSDASFVRYPTYSWQEETCWLPEEIEDDREKLLVGDAVRKDDCGGCVYESEIDCHRFPFLNDHKLVDIGTAFPGAGYVEMALETILHGKQLQSVEIKDQTFDNLLNLPQDAVQKVRTTVKSLPNSNQLDIVINKVVEEGEYALATSKIRAFSTEHKGLKLSEVVDPESTKRTAKLPYDMYNIRRTSTQHFEKEELRAIVQEAGVLCGESFSLLEEAWRSNGRLLVRLSLPTSIFEELPQFVIHPAIIDATFQSVIVALNNNSLNSVVPIKVGKLVVFPVTKKTSNLYTLVKYDLQDTDKTSVQLLIEEGDALMLVRDVKVVNLQKIPPKLSLEKSAYQLSYISRSVDDFQESSADDFNWILLGLKNEETHRIFQDYMQGVGTAEIQTTLIEVNPLERYVSSTADIQKQLIDASDDERCNVLVNFIPAEIYNEGPEVLASSQRMLFHYCFDILGALFNGEGFDYRLVLITAEEVNCHMSDSDVPQTLPDKVPVSSCVWGFVKSVRLEMPSQIIGCADIRSSPSGPDFNILLKHCTSDPVEPDIVIRGNECYFPRMSALESHPTNSMCYIPASQLHVCPHYLTMNSIGDFRAYRDHDSSLTSKSCVEIQIAFASSMLGDTGSFSSSSLPTNKPSNGSIICYSGIITQTGDNSQMTPLLSNVISFQEGHRIHNQLRVESSKVVPLPNTLSLSQAAAISGPISVASKLIKHITKLNPSVQSCLIATHDCNQEFSFMIMLAAKAYNWDICTTDLSYDEDMDSLGIGFVNIQDLFHVIDSTVTQSLIFDCVITTTDLEENKLDILSGCVKPGGSFVAIDKGRENLTKPKTFGISITNKTITSDIFRCYQLTEKDLLEEWTQICPLLNKSGSIWSKAMNRKVKVVDPYLSSNVFKGLSLNTVQMNSSKEDCVKVEECALDDFGLHKDGTYLVIGGHKGFGLETSIWLSEMGASCIVTCGRSPLEEKVQEQFSSIALRKALRFRHVICDITKSEGIDILASELSTLPKLRGIISSAVVYDDRLFNEIDYESFQKVLGPKVTGTIRLSKMVDDLGAKLDFFILYSSIVSGIGNVGQASYAAANFFMNEFANRMKRLTGQNFLSVCWGPMSDAGFLAENEDIATIITERIGLHMIPAKTGLRWLETILKNHSKLSTVFLTSFDWRKLSSPVSPFKDNPMLKGLFIDDFKNKNDSSTLVHLDALRMCKTEEERWTLLSTYMRTWLARWLGTAEETEVDLNAPLSNYGLDSSRASQFQARLLDDFCVTIPLLIILRPDTTGNRLVHLLLQELKVQLASDKDKSKSDKVSLDNKSKSSVSSTSVKNNSNDNKLVFDMSFIGLAYSPPYPLHNFFWVHSANRYRGSMLQKAEGFKCQDVFQVYAIGSEDNTYKGKAEEDIRPLAIAYVDLIMKVQPRGPYFIGGYSFGGHIAYEMASVMTERKEVVAMLVMLDTQPWVSESTANAKYLFTCGDMAASSDIKTILNWHIKSVAVQRLGMDEREFERIYSDNNLDDIVTYVEEFAKSKSIDNINLNKLVDAVSHNVSISREAKTRWTLPKVTYNGPVLFVEAEDRTYTPSFPGYGSNSACWKRIIRSEQFYVHLTEGDHYTMFRKRSAFMMYGRVISTMARMILRQNFPHLYSDEALPFNTLSLQTINQGIRAVLGRGKKGIPGVLKASFKKRRLKFKPKKNVPGLRKKLLFPFSDIVNIIKASDSIKTGKDTSTMGILIWMHNKEFAIFVESWLDYLKVIHGLQAVFRMKLPLL